MGLANIKGFIGKRSTRYGTNATVLTAAFVAIVVLLNILAARHPYRIDLTAEKQYTLSPQTVNVLRGLEEPVTITLFFTQAYEGRTQAQDLMREYAARSDKLTYEIIDPELRPALATQFGIQVDGTAVFQQGDRRQDLRGVYDEQNVTAALIKVTRPEAKTVYFLTGHREHDIVSAQAGGYSTIREMLQQDNYNVRSLNLTEQGGVPEDSAILVIAAPQTEFNEPERKWLTDWVNNGGRIAMLSDPQQPKILPEVIGQWGIEWREDIVVDPASSFFGDVATPMVQQYPYHETTKDLAGYISIFPYARSIGVKEQPEDVTIAPLALSSEQAWGEVNLSSQQVQFNADADTRGPLALGMVIEQAGEEGADSPKVRAALFGDSDFISNQVLQSMGGQLGNGELFLNAINWLAEESELIAIRPKAPADRTIVMTAGQTQLVFVTSTILLPLVVLGYGVWVWWRQR